MTTRWSPSAVTWSIQWSAVACAGKKLRGVVYNKAKDAAQRVVARPNDDVIVYQHRIEHR